MKKSLFFVAVAMFFGASSAMAQREYVVNGDFSQVLEDEKTPAVWEIIGSPCLSEAKGKLKEGTDGVDNYLVVWESDCITGYDVKLIQTIKGLKGGDNYVLSCLAYAGWMDEVYLEVKGDKGLDVKITIEPDSWGTKEYKEEYISVEDGENVTITLSCYEAANADKPGPLALFDDVSFLNPEEEPSAINNVYAKVKNGAVYNLAGQRVTVPAKGVYIANGKKVVLK